MIYNILDKKKTVESKKKKDFQINIKYYSMKDDSQFSEYKQMKVYKFTLSQKQFFLDHLLLCIRVEAMFY